MFPNFSLTIKRKNTALFHYLIVMAGLLIALCQYDPAQAQSTGLIFAPTILEFEGRDRYATLTLVNRGAKTHSYRISFINQKMLENGQMEPTASPAEHEGFAGQYLRYSPRQITLSPGKPQTIRVMLRLPAGVKEGEYRSHLLFQQIPDALAPVSKISEDGDLGVSITAKFGISIPAFIRVGELKAEAEISEIKQLEKRDGKEVLGFVINRTGNKTVRGHITVRADGKKVGYLSGLPIYLSANKRLMDMQLDSRDLAGKKIQIEYKERGKDGGNIIALAEKQF